MERNVTVFSMKYVGNVADHNKLHDQTKPIEIKSIPIK